MIIGPGYVQVLSEFFDQIIVSSRLSAAFSLLLAHSWHMDLDIRPT
jgi:hypothetical protein